MGPGECLVACTSGGAKRSVAPLPIPVSSKSIFAIPSSAVDLRELSSGIRAEKNYYVRNLGLILCSEFKDTFFAGMSLIHKRK